MCCLGDVDPSASILSPGRRMYPAILFLLDKNHIVLLNRKKSYNYDEKDAHVAFNLISPRIGSFFTLIPS